MHKTIKARYHNGQLEPLEPLELDEGSEVLITIDSPALGPPSGPDPTLATSGVFKGSRHWEELEKELEERRCRESPPE
jgi:predicted DNA-binding antitoxin AbrB/MazE fold protein